jgi:hypothetical protein
MLGPSWPLRANSSANVHAISRISSMSPDSTHGRFESRGIISLPSCPKGCTNDATVCNLPDTEDKRRHEGGFWTVGRASLAAGPVQRVNRRRTAVSSRACARTSKGRFQRLGIRFSPVAKWEAPERAKRPIVTALSGWHAFRLISRRSRTERRLQEGSGVPWPRRVAVTRRAQGCGTQLDVCVKLAIARAKPLPSCSEQFFGCTSWTKPGTWMTPKIAPSPMAVAF